MYYVTKKMEISGSHYITLERGSKCERLHGHNWIITVYCKAEELNENGMVEDFTVVKHKIKDMLDHRNLNEVFPFNPTAENIAHWITEQIPTCYKARVQESEGNSAIYEE